MSAAAARSYPSWSSWEPLPLTLSPGVLALILDDGQAFRWHALKDASWLGFWSSYAVRLRLSSTSQLEWSAPAEAAASTRPALLHYLALNSDFDQLSDRLPWRSDEHLARCMQAMPGLRLLRQPLGETLLCFLCSATKQIPQICEMAEAMAANLGSPLPFKKPASEELSGLSFHQLPTWAQLAKASESALRACSLGFRASNVVKTAAFLADNPGYLEACESLTYEQAHARLCELPGVGPKIADCVLLYSGTQLKAFPVDTWIIKAMARRYDLDGWEPTQVAHFGRQHFGRAAGLAQQYLFNFERLLSREPHSS